ncbi:MAG: acyl transferase [Bacteroidetes bacterium]|nr:MAG: acyl transferase [Bacteroidota bacterium]
MQTPERQDLLSEIADLAPADFESVALKVFRYQAAHNPLYGRFVHLLSRHPEGVLSMEQIPFLPVSLFKQYAVQSGSWKPEAVFTSSSTTGQVPSRHLVRDMAFYLEHTEYTFSRFYGDLSDWCVLALLPSYLERSGSSLVAMADYFIRKSTDPRSGFFLHDLESLRVILSECQNQGKKTLLLGVSFALLNLAEQFPMDLSGIAIMETGGMKGRRREMTRQELHEILSKAFQVSGIHSEYGMTELFSQAYSLPAQAAGAPARFRPAHTLRAIPREVNDPFCPAPSGRTGVLQFIDLANLDTCSFIATEDLGKTYSDGSFEVLGRLDAAEWRGCNLLVE